MLKRNCINKNCSSKAICPFYSEDDPRIDLPEWAHCQPHRESCNQLPLDYKNKNKEVKREKSIL